MSSEVASLKVLKSFPYRGGTRIWSNRYHFVSGSPPDSTHWTTLSDAVVSAEHNGLMDWVQIVGTYGYAAGSDVPVFSKTYSTTGALTIGGEIRAPGDCAAVVRFGTASRTRKNHPLYLFNYVHGIPLSAASTPDVIHASYVSALATYAAAWITGFSDGSTTYHRSGPRGDLATGQLVSSTVKHRDFP